MVNSHIDTATISHNHENHEVKHIHSQVHGHYAFIRNKVPNNKDEYYILMILLCCQILGHSNHTVHTNDYLFPKEQVVHQSRENQAVRIYIVQTDGIFFAVTEHALLYHQMITTIRILL